MFQFTNAMCISKYQNKALDSITAPSTGHLKTSKKSPALRISTCIILYNYFQQMEPECLTLMPGHFRVAEFPFISKFRVDFQTQLMNPTKYIPTVSKYIPTVSK